MAANIGVCRIELGQVDDGARGLLKAYEFDQENPKAIANFALGLAFLGDFEQAIEFSAPKLDTTRPNAELAANYIQACAFSDTESTPLSNIPKSLHTSLEVQMAMLHFHRVKGDQEWIKIALALSQNHSDHSFIKRCEAEAKLAEVLNDTRNGRSAISDKQKEALATSHTALCEIWSDICKLPIERQINDVSVISNILLAGQMLDLEEELDKLISRTDDQVWCDDQVILKLCQYGVKYSKTDLLSKFVPKIIDEAARFNFKYYQALQSQDWQSVQTFWDEGSQNVRADDAEFFEVASRCAHYFLHPDDLTEDIVADILPNSMADARSAVLLIDLINGANLELQSIDIYSRAVELASKTDSVDERQMVARACSISARWRDVIKLLVTRTKPADDNDASRMLASVYANTRPAIASGKTFFSQLNKAQAVQVDYVEKAAIYHLNRGAYVQAGAVLEKFFSANPDCDLRFHKLYIISLWRQKKMDDVDAYISKLDASVPCSDPSEKTRLANLMLDRSQPELGMKIAYSALKDGDGNERVQAGYCMNVFMHTAEESSQAIFPPVNAVKLDTWVTLADVDGREYSYLFSAEPENEPKFIYPIVHGPNNNMVELAKCAEDKKVGDTFTVENKMGGGETTWKVIGVCHKYQFAFTKLRDDFPARFPQSNIMGVYRMVGDDVTPILDKTKSDLEKRAAIADLYTQNQIPFTWIAGFQKVAPVSFVGYLLQNGAEVFSNSGFTKERATAGKLLESAESKIAVLDAFSAWTAACTGMLDVLKLIFDELRLSQQDFDLLQKMMDDVHELKAGQMLRIPGHPAGHSDNIRPPKPGYPATLVQRLRGLRFWVSSLGVFVTCFEFGFPHALAVEFDAVGIMHEAVEDGVGEGGFADHVMPCVDRQLAGDQG